MPVAMPEGECSSARNHQSRHRRAVAAKAAAVALGLFASLFCSRMLDAAPLPTVQDTKVHAAPKQKLAEDGSHRRWHHDHVTIVLDSSLARLGDGADDAVRLAVGAWLQTNASLPNVSFVVDSGPEGRAERDQVSRVMAGPIDLKGHEHDLAYAAVYTTAGSGDILEADIVLNTSFKFALLDVIESPGPDGVMQPQSVHQSCSGRFDLQSVATHEFGHFFGLGEDVDDQDATMYFKTSKCEVKKRTLQASDADAIALVYASDREEPEAQGCSVSTARRSGAGGLLIACTVGLGLALARRRISPRRNPAK